MYSCPLTPIPNQVMETLLFNGGDIFALQPRPQDHGRHSCRRLVAHTVCALESHSYLSSSFPYPRSIGYSCLGGHLDALLDAVSGARVDLLARLGDGLEDLLVRQGRLGDDGGGLALEGHLVALDTYKIGRGRWSVWGVRIEEAGSAGEAAGR